MRIASYLQAWKSRPPDSGNGHNFKEVALPHLRASYRLARWLTRDHDEAEEVVQEAYLTAFKHFDSYNGGNAQAWILSIVRNTFYSSLRRRRADEDSFDEEHYCSGAYEANTGTALPDTNPEAVLLRQEEMKLVCAAVEALPVALREVLVLRAFDELSYNEIAEITNIPLGTVMSRLARARRYLAKRLAPTEPECK